MNPARDEFEIPLVRAAIDRGLPTLCICRGVQVLDVALGGTLHQHITDRERVAHRNDDGTDGVLHEVRVQPGPRVMKAMGVERARTVSHHHQAIDRLGSGLWPSAGPKTASSRPSRWKKAGCSACSGTPKRPPPPTRPSRPSSTPLSGKPPAPSEQGTRPESRPAGRSSLSRVDITWIIGGRSPKGFAASGSFAYRSEVATSLWSEVATDLYTPGCDGSHASPQRMLAHSRRVRASQGRAPMRSWVAAARRSVLPPRSLPPVLAQQPEMEVVGAEDPSRGGQRAGRRRARAGRTAGRRHRRRRGGGEPGEDAAVGAAK